MKLVKLVSRTHLYEFILVNPNIVGRIASLLAD
eukprot:COSAG02_NODE_19251_length_892_cov_1.266078_2_plen_32_part_01